MTDFIHDNIMLHGVVGSQALGTAIAGRCDRDEMAITIEPLSYVVGLDHFEQHIQRDKPEGIRSEAGDLDLTIYGLRKYMRLAVKGNPSILLLLFLPSYIKKTARGDALLEIRETFHSKHAGSAFLGYLRAQKMKLTGQRSPEVSRPELVEKFGYDVKFASHAVRLGEQGVEFIKTAHLELPLPEPVRSKVLDIKTGGVPLETVLKDIDRLESELSAAVDKCVAIVDMKRVNEFLIGSYPMAWL